jgi:nucleoside-diphosphate-sugar epimerase
LLIRTAVEIRSPEQRLMNVFITGSTGYLGRALCESLAGRGHTVSGLCRPKSIRKLPLGVKAAPGDALTAESFAGSLARDMTLVHLVGVSHPAPWKEAEFRAVDLASVRASLEAARRAGVSRMIYVSVAQPAPVMRSYLRVRAECEELIRTSGLTATILRPWYVLGPGHRWPVALIPAYRILELLPSTRDSATRLGLVTHGEMVSALVWAVEHPAAGLQILDVPGIRGVAQC